MDDTLIPFALFLTVGCVVAALIGQHLAHVVQALPF